jgi:hypothetical protein
MIAYAIFFTCQPLAKRRGFPYGNFFGVREFFGRVAIGVSPTLLSGESRGGEGGRFTLPLGILHENIRSRIWSRILHILPPCLG